MTPDDRFDATEAGRALGHDLYRWRRQPGADGWPQAVREGFTAAQASRLATCTPDRFVRKWLQLRLGALRRGRTVADDVTAEGLRRIDVAVCPVTRTTLTHGELLPSDWSVDRLNNAGGYAANNLAVMSTLANRAKGARTYEEVFALSQRGAPCDGLAPAEWLRLAALMLGPCFAETPSKAPAIPLAAPIPNGTVRPAVQQIQHVFTRHARRPAGKNALIREFKPTSAGERSLTRLRGFAEALHDGLKGLDECHDAWLRPGVMSAFVAWRQSLDEPAWALAGAISRRLARSSVVPAARLASWHLETGGHAPGRRPAAERHRLACGALPVAWARTPPAGDAPRHFASLSLA